MHTNAGHQNLGDVDEPSTHVRSAVLVGPDAVEMRDTPHPQVQDGEVLVRVSYTGICGSDFPIIAGVHPRVQLPLIMGHEITGVVVGSGSPSLPVGTQVAVNPLVPCGNCGACAQGLLHVCRSLRLRGIDLDGSMTELITVPESSVVPFVEGVEPREAALVEPLAVAVHAVERAGLVAGERVLIFGAGPIGILVAMVARHAGASEVTIVEPGDARRRIAAALHFVAIAPDEVQRARDRGDDEAPTVVFDCAGHPSVSSVITDVAPVHGRIVVVAVHQGRTEIDLREVAFAEHTLIGVRVYQGSNFEDAVQLINEQSLPLADIPVSEYGLDQVREAFAEAKSVDGAVKVLVRSAR